MTPHYANNLSSDFLLKKLGSYFFLLLTSYFLLLTSASAQNANFSASPVTGCAPLQVYFTDLSTGNPTAWNWNFGNSVTSTFQNPTAFYFNPGVYTVTLTVTGANTDTEIKTNYIVVYDKPQANFTMSTDTACVGQVVTFTDASVIATNPNGAPIGSWIWDFGDGNTQAATSSPVTHAYSLPGNYQVNVIVTDVNGCGGGSMVHNIVIVPSPTPAFTADTLFACTPPLTVTFTNNSISSGQTTYTWNFGDGNTSTVPNLNPTVHTYTTSGSFNVTLIINQSGCIDSLLIPSYIIIQNITASFVATPTVVCSGQSISFNNTSAPAATSASWTFGDGNSSTTISPANTYNTAGTYTVTLIAGENGCFDTTTGTVLVNQTPVASFTADTMVACNVPFTVTFTSTGSGGTNYSWNFGDGGTSALQNPVHTYTASGVYSVTLTVTNSSGPCVTTIVMPNYITISPPIASFVHAPDSGCVPLTVNFLSTSTSLIDPIATYSWSFGDGSNSTTAATGISHTYTATGIYTVTLIIQTANGCSDTIVCPGCIHVGTPPFANFGIVEDTVCYGLPVNFLDSSTGNVTGWYWSFGDGGSSTQQNPTYTYGDTGTYQVYLIAYNNGCADTSVIKNVVILPPKAVFTYSLSCTNYYIVQFSDASEGADSLFWDFGDGSQDSSNILNPVHTYPVRGPFTVTLTAYNYSTGCFNSASASFTIAEPIASYTVNPDGCYPFTANFTSTSQDANTYWWNFGDPSTILDTSLISNPSYTYNNPAAYTVTFIITDVNGCKDTLQDTVKSLGPLPYFFADTLTGCRPLPVTFIDTSISDSVLVQWIWDFGDGTIDTTNNDSIIHIYTTPGNYAVTMTVKDTNGCMKIITINNYIQPTFPYPAFTVDTFACKGDLLTYTYTGTAVVPNTYLWDFGDANTSTLQNPTHAYTNDGLYIVSLTVTDINGCDSTLTDTVRILKPTANFSWAIDTMLCNNLVIDFTDLSTGFVNAWSWNFGNGGTSTGQNPSAIYSSGGIYSVTLIVTNAGGCIDTIVMDSIINVPFPTGSFSLTPTSGCNPLTVCFNSISINTINYFWDFGDGGTASIQNPCHLYTNAGQWIPHLILEDTLADGSPCQTVVYPPDTVLVTNIINVSLSGPSVITVPADSIIAVTATYSGGVPPYTYYWTPATGLNCDTCTSVLIIGTGDTIVYTFIIYDSSGCIGKDSIFILSEPCLQEKLIPNVFTPNGDGYNDIFYIPGVCPGDKYSLQIYDRWGVLLFTTTLRNNGWDGRTNAGIQAKDGTYYYVVSMHVKQPTEEDRIYKGFVELIR
ncbi:MAG: PKD domain-containing protein [Bacteroidetes bacterium]|nr:PKD domain-containing protein [Bacteroidota bacterium]